VNIEIKNKNGIFVKLLDVVENTLISVITENKTIVTLYVSDFANELDSEIKNKYNDVNNFNFFDQFIEYFQLVYNNSELIEVPDEYIGKSIYIKSDSSDLSIAIIK
jgi:hypothetical protein